MLALFIFAFLSLALVSITIELIYKSAHLRRLWYIILMCSGLLIVGYHYNRLIPLAVTNRFEIQGQYFPLNRTITISGAPSNADYYAPSLLVESDTDSLKENPIIVISGYDDQKATLQVTARATARPFRHNDEIVNVAPLKSGDEIRIGNAHFTFENGLLSRSEFVIGQAHYKVFWPDVGSAKTLGELLCEEGLDRSQQRNAVAQLISSPDENPLDHLWIVRKDWWTLGLVNGSKEIVKISGVELQPEVRFTIKTGDKLVYGAGRNMTSLGVTIDPAANRIYVLPERRQNYPLYQPPDISREAEVFISSTATIASPAYELSLGERNRDLVKGALKYKFEGGEIKQFILNSGIELRKFEGDQTAALGSSNGGIVFRLTDEKMSRWRPLIYVGVIWVTVMTLFLFLGGIERSNYLFVILPIVHLLLAIRLVLSYRAYILPPYYEESYEKALFALIFVPFAIFVWLYIRDISAPFDLSGYVASQRKLFGLAGQNITRTIVTTPPFLFMLLSLALMWLVGIFSFARLALVVGFFAVSLLIAWAFSTLGDWSQSQEPIIAWLASDRRWDIVVLFAVPLGLPLLLRLFGLGAEVIPSTGLRAELFYLPCLFLGSCRLYIWFFRKYFTIGQTVPYLAHLWLIVPFLLYFAEAFIVGDWGFLIYSVPVFILAVIVSWRADRIVSASVVALCGTVLVLFFLTPLFSQRVAAVLPKGSTIEYRYLAYQNPGWLQEAVLEASDSDQSEGLWQKIKMALTFGSAQSNCYSGTAAARRVLAANEHFWTMYHFAARGATGVGFGEAPIERVPFPNGIAQSDNAYSIYVMAEHGGVGGIALLSIYVVFTMVLLFVLTQHFASELEPALIVAGIGLTILFAAFYHASGNVNGLPFTGKNLPLLSLNSNADILLVSLLLAFAISVIARGRSDLPSHGRGLMDAFRDKGNTLNRWLLLIGLCFSLLFFPAVCHWTVKAENDEVHRGDYDLSGFVERAKQYIADGVIDLDKQNERLTLRTDKATGLAEKQYLRLLCDQFNAASADEKKSGKYFFMIKKPVLDEDVFGPKIEGDRYQETLLTVDQNYFKRASPFTEKVQWRGELHSSDADAGQQGYLVGEGINLFLTHVFDADKPIPGVDNTVPATVANPDPPNFPGDFLTSRRFKVQNRRGKQLFDFYAIEGDAVLEPKAEGTYVNGQEIRDKLRLEPGDIVSIRGSPQTGNHPLVFTYQQGSAGLLAKIHWRNGHDEFTFPQGEMFALARPIVEAINANVGQSASGKRETLPIVNESLNLSLSADLNRRAYEILAKEAQGYKDGDREIPGLWEEISQKRGLPPRLGITVMNPQSGEILALASWPSFDPNPQPPQLEKSNPYSYSSLVAGRTPESRRFLSNHNLTRHVLGSATKPFIVGAAASAFPQILTLITNDNAQSYSQVLGISTRPEWQGEAQGTANWNRFFAESNNLFAVTAGFFGLSNSADQRIRFTTTTTPQQYEMDGRRSSLQPDFSDVFNPKTGEALKIENTHLASQLQELFGVQISGPDADPMIEIWRDAQAKSLLPTDGSALTFISPEEPNLALNNVRSGRDFVAVCLGGYTNLWSNVKSAEAFSRLVTGRRIQATMVHTESPAQFERLSHLFDVVRPPLLDALEGVTAPGGTAANLAPAIAAINHGSSVQAGERFAMFAKTGTLEGQYMSGRNDSNMIFAAGMYNPASRTLRNAVVVSIFIEQGNRKGDSGRATLVALKLMKVLNQHFGWNATALR